MKLSILIPCFNECRTIEEILTRVDACAYQPKEIIVIDDGSTDGTRDILMSRPARNSEQIIFREKNQGKHATCQACLIAS
jgi:glycosyltransferase involved in cell wall biosynthesis